MRAATYSFGGCSGLSRYDYNSLIGKQALTVEQCQEHAKACRDLARGEPNQQTRKGLEDLAASWEQLCEEMTKMANGHASR